MNNFRASKIYELVSTSRSTTILVQFCPNTHFKEELYQLLTPNDRKMESPDQSRDYGLLLRELRKDLNRFPLE